MLPIPLQAMCFTFICVNLVFHHGPKKEEKKRWEKSHVFFFYLLSEIVVSKNVIFISATDRAETRTCL